MYTNQRVGMTANGVCNSVHTKDQVSYLEAPSFATGDVVVDWYNSQGITRCQRNHHPRMATIVTKPSGALREGSHQVMGRGVRQRGPLLWTGAASGGSSWKPSRRPSLGVAIRATSCWLWSIILTMSTALLEAFKLRTSTHCHRSRCLYPCAAPALPLNFHPQNLDFASLLGHYPKERAKHVR